MFPRSAHDLTFFKTSLLCKRTRVGTGFALGALKRYTSLLAGGQHMAHHFIYRRRINV
ncbi:hypothetical protein R2A130_0969 [Ahrensia sp. R2A130]|nr:hypothetical protein R2A130_0969 [Ahrensia sp. R2A130]